MTGSSALFVCDPPSKPLKLDTFINKNGSWEGCLLSTQELKPYQKL